MENRAIPEWTDEQLVQKIVSSKDNTLFAELFSRYREKVLNKCYTMTKSRIVSEDLVQDIMVKAMEKLSSFKGNATFGTWLYAISYNHCIEYLRKNKRIRYDDWATDVELPEDVSESEIQEVLHLKSQRLTLLLELLKPEDKAIILMKYKEGFDTKKIAYILALETESAAKMRLNRAKKRLIALFQEFFPSKEA